VRLVDEQMIGCGLFLTSSMTFFKRRSNLLLTLAPACSKAGARCEEC